MEVEEISENKIATNDKAPERGFLIIFQLRHLVTKLYSNANSNVRLMKGLWLWKKCVIKQHPILTAHYLSTYIARTRIWLKKMLKSAAPMETILKSLVNKFHFRIGW
ncbi:uncharacterized protein [Eurosta solidaginis]|uniref:uncharacterized protein isoform X2 n=1 Tax=Eurosta solidaginis TaxID=178769 RepID=UPI0035317CE8